MKIIKETVNFILYHKKAVIRSAVAVVLTALIGSVGELISSLNDNTSKLLIIQNNLTRDEGRFEANFKSINTLLSTAVHRSSWDAYILRKDREYDQQTRFNEEIIHAIGYLQGLDHLYHSPDLDKTFDIKK